MRLRTPRLPKPLEKDVQSACLDYLRLFGAFAIRVNSGAFAGEHKGKKWFVKLNDQPGCSDVLCVLPDGRFGAFEIKRPGWTYNANDERTARQSAFLAEVRKRGGVAGFVTGIDDLRAVLRANGYEAG